MFYIHVNKHRIAANRKNGTNLPTVRYQKGKYGKSHYCDRLKFLQGEIIYSHDKPILPCGARLVIATPFEPEVIE